MKNSAILILTTLIIVACHSPAYISGRLEGIEKKDIMIYLIEPEILRDVAASYLDNPV